MIVKAVYCEELDEYFVMEYATIADMYEGVDAAEMYLDEKERAGDINGNN